MIRRFALAGVAALGLLASACGEREAQAEGKPPVLLYEAPVITILAPKVAAPETRLARGTAAARTGGS